MCQAKDDDDSAGSDGTDQLLLRRRRKRSVLWSTQKGLSWPVCFQGRKNKETEIWCSPLRWPRHRKILTPVSVLVSLLHSLSEDLHLFGCAGSAVPVAALAPCFLKGSRSVFVTLDHISPLLMFLVRMRRQRWSWMRQWRLLSECLFDCNKDFFFSPSLLINQRRGLCAVIWGQWRPKLSQKSNFQTSEVLNTCTSDFVQSDCKEIYRRRSDCILRVILHFFCKMTENKIFPTM